MSPPCGSPCATLRTRDAASPQPFARLSFCASLQRSAGCLTLLHRPPARHPRRVTIQRHVTTRPGPVVRVGGTSTRFKPPRLSYFRDIGDGANSGTASAFAGCFCLQPLVDWDLAEVALPCDFLQRKAVIAKRSCVVLQRKAAIATRSCFVLQRKAATAARSCFVLQRKAATATRSCVVLQRKANRDDFSVSFLQRKLPGASDGAKLLPAKEALPVWRCEAAPAKEALPSWSCKSAPTKEALPSWRCETAPAKEVSAVDSLRLLPGRGASRLDC